MSQLVSIDRWNRSFVFSHDSVKDPGSTFTKIDRDILDAKLEPLRQRWDRESEAAGPFERHSRDDVRQSQLADIQLLDGRLHTPAAAHFFDTRNGLETQHRRHG